MRKGNKQWRIKIMKGGILLDLWEGMKEDKRQRQKGLGREKTISRKRRKKASTIYRDAKYLFSGKVPFEEAFPTIEHISVKVKERGNTSNLGEPRIFHKGDFGEYIDCTNLTCHGGGFSIGSIIREMVADKKEELETKKHCPGYEGSSKGRRYLRPCLNFFEIKVKIKYKES